MDTIHVGDALTVLKTLPSESVNCVVTSPPYYGLRDYGVEGQIGLEETPQEFIGKLIAVFSEVRRVLRKDGVVWVNLGDSYGSSEIGRHDSVQGRSIDGHAVTAKLSDHRQRRSVTTSPKNLLMVPARFAIAMQDAGWILRSECVWVKPNPMPESVTDRPTKSHEMVYLFAKSSRYWFDADAIREPVQQSTVARYTRGWNGDGERGFPDGPQNHMKKFMANEDAKKQAIERGANHRSIFTVNTEPTPFAHFATFPQALIEPLILAGCPEKVCAECGKPYVRETEKGELKYGDGHTRVAKRQRVDASDYDAWSRPDGLGATQVPGAFYERIDKGIHATCKCNADTRGGVVLDPFMGSGTTALVARRLGRHYIGVELNAEYAALAETRLQHTSKQELAAALEGKPTTQPMF